MQLQKSCAGKKLSLLYVIVFATNWLKPSMRTTMTASAKQKKILKKKNQIKNLLVNKQFAQYIAVCSSPSLLS